MWKLNIKTRFLLGTIGIVMGLGLAMLVLARFVLYDSLYANLEKRGEFIARKVAQDSISPVLTERFFELRMMINDVKHAEGDIVYIFVQRDSGEVLAHTFGSGFPEDLRTLHGDGQGTSGGMRLLETHAGMVIDFSAPFFRGAGGKVHVGIAEAPIRQEVNRTLLKLLGGLFAVVVLGSGTAVVLAVSITGPIRDLAVAVEALERGDLRARVPVRSDDEAGRLSAAFNAMADERERVESALLQNERKLRGITAGLGEGVLVVDVEGRVTFMNPAAERLLGWTEAELAGKHFHDTVHHRKEDGSRYPASECPSLKVSTSGEQVVVDDDIYIRKDGTELPVSHVAAPIMEEGRIVAIVTAFQDITLRKKREAEREKLILDHLDALTRVRTLSGMLPICASCKKVRDDAGYWKQIESYITEHSDTEFSHGICPECAQKLYPDYFKKKT